MVKYIAIALSSLSLLLHILWFGWRYFRKSRARLDVWSLTTVFAIPAGTSTNNDLRPKITLLFRNRSERATSIVDLKVRKEEGGVLGGRGYKERVCLPINIAPWEVKRVEFRMDKTDKNNMDHIYVRDIDDHKLEIKPSSGDWDRVSTKSWY